MTTTSQIDTTECRCALRALLTQALLTSGERPHLRYLVEAIDAFVKSRQPHSCSRAGLIAEVVGEVRECAALHGDVPCSWLEILVLSLTGRLAAPTPSFQRAILINER